MAEKPEVFLEIGAGFLRIPTAEVTYNIAVCSTTNVENTRDVPPQGASSLPQAGAQAEISADRQGDCGDNDFYRAVSADLYNDIGHLAKNLSSTIMDIPREDRLQKRVSLDEAGDRIEDAKGELKDIVDMTEKAAMEIMDNVERVQSETGNVQQLLDDLKNHNAFMSESEADQEEDDDSVGELCAVLRNQLDKGLKLLTSSAEGAVVDAPSADLEIEQIKGVRYLFNIDVIFQTLYELCTNETVKEHITTARDKAQDIFDTSVFQDTISIKAKEYQADDDNYFNVPMSDVFQSLFAACDDKGIKNLLKKMDKGQATIFLDQAIPLEVPDTEEIVVSSSPPLPNSDSATSEPELSSQVKGVISILESCLASLTELEDKCAHGVNNNIGMSLMTMSDQQDIFAKIESAFGVAASITNNVSKITESLSFQDLSGQRIMKIIKLLSDFQVQLLAIVVSFGSQLKQREENRDLSVEESKELAQADVDKLLGPSVDKEGEGEPLDQDTVNSLLAEMGF